MASFDFSRISPTSLGTLLRAEQCMAHTLLPLWEGARLSGPAYTVRLPRGQNLALHAAIYRAEPGSVLVVQASDDQYAVAGGNVCAVAQRRGIAGIVVDGVIRDRAEIRQMRFPVFARGVRPIPGGKSERGEWQVPVECGGFRVNPGDSIVADEEGIVCVPEAQAQVLGEAAHTRQKQEHQESLDSWAHKHREGVNKALATWGEEL
ncbi:RraA family protein [Deinococcus oregonensis]|uniref:Regulator of ribonuclease activity homolog n=1 Tax=Deinococcus oregonensis TaxID=1805970 RepID=A0ABV6AYS0_9DEIO